MAMTTWRLAIASLLLLASGFSLGAQAHVPRGAADSTAQSRLVFSATVGLQSAEVRSSLLQSLPLAQRAVAMRAVDVSLHRTGGGVGLHGRFLQSTLGQEDLTLAEVGVLAGFPSFSVEASYLTRTGYSPESGLLHGESYRLGRAGIRSVRALGNSPFRVSFRGGVYVPTEVRARAAEASGWEGESLLLLRSLRTPLQLSVGYRLERLRVADLEQEVSALLLGFGFAFGEGR